MYTCTYTCTMVYINTYNKDIFHYLNMYIVHVPCTYSWNITSLFSVQTFHGMDCVTVSCSLVSGNWVGMSRDEWGP